MKTPDIGSSTPEVKKQLSLNQVYYILKGNAARNEQNMCQRMGNMLNFWTLFGSEQDAKIAYNQLVELGQKPSLDKKNVFLAAEFPGEEIDKLAETDYHIPKREKKGRINCQKKIICHYV